MFHTPHRSRGRRRPGRSPLARSLKILAGLTLLIAFRAPLSRAADGTSLAGNLELRKGDHISLIGNTLADRMQHDGWLETYLQSRFPRHELVIRNLGFSGDEIPLPLRLRSAGFGSPDQWLTRTKTDVVFAFFGYNESFKGKDGLPKFKDVPKEMGGSGETLPE